MHILVNERSFVGQASAYNANHLIQQLLAAINGLIPLSCGHPVLRDSTLRTRPLIGDDICLIQWINNHPDKDFRTRLLSRLTKGPQLEEFLDDVSHECEFDGSDVAHSSIAGAAYFNGVLVSLDGCPVFAADPLSVLFCSGPSATLVTKSVRNLTSDLQVWTVRRRYVYSPKHIRGYGWGTEMPLSDEDAQRVLDCSEIDGNDRQAYGLHDGEFYEFQPDGAGGYHGYPVRRVEVPQAVVRRLLGIDSN